MQTENADQLSQESQFLVHVNDDILEKVTVLKAKIFSAPYRKRLFGFFIANKTKTIEEVVSQNQEIILTSNIIIDKTKSFIKRVSTARPFKLRKHNLEALIFLKEGLDTAKKIKNKIELFQKLFLVLDKDLSRKKKQKVVEKIKNNFNELIENITENKANFGDFSGRFRINKYLQQSVDNIIENNLIKGKGYRLKSGDILVSFKTLSYLQKEEGNKISNWVRRFTGSQVTHVGIFFWGNARKLKIIHAFENTNYGIETLGLSEGEVYIVLRPRINANQRIKLWKVIRERIKQGTKFSTNKMLTVVPSILINRISYKLFRKRVEAGQVFDNTKTRMFCSEFLNQVFKDAGFLLTPKSKYSIDVYPGDIMASPFVDYVGLLFLDSEFTKEKIKNEILKGVKL
jgi:hypothetical protein